MKVSGSFVDLADALSPSIHVVSDDAFTVLSPLSLSAHSPRSQSASSVASSFSTPFSASPAHPQQSLPSHALAPSSKSPSPLLSTPAGSSLSHVRAQLQSISAALRLERQQRNQLKEGITPSTSTSLNSTSSFSPNSATAFNHIKNTINDPSTLETPKQSAYPTPNIIAASHSLFSTASSPVPTASSATSSVIPSTSSSDRGINHSSTFTPNTKHDIYLLNQTPFTNQSSRTTRWLRFASPSPQSAASAPPAPDTVDHSIVDTTSHSPKSMAAASSISPSPSPDTLSPQSATPMINRNSVSALSVLSPNGEESVQHWRSQAERLRMQLNSLQTELNLKTSQQQDMLSEHQVQLQAAQMEAELAKKDLSNLQLQFREQIESKRREKEAEDEAALLPRENDHCVAINEHLATISSLQSELAHLKAQQLQDHSQQYSKDDEKREPATVIAEQEEEALVQRLNDLQLEAHYHRDENAELHEALEERTRELERSRREARSLITLYEQEANSSKQLIAELKARLHQSQEELATSKEQHLVSLEQLQLERGAAVQLEARRTDEARRFQSTTVKQIQHSTRLEQNLQELQRAHEGARSDLLQSQHVVQSLHRGLCDAKAMIMMLRSQLVSIKADTATLQLSHQHMWTQVQGFVHEIEARYQDDLHTMAEHHHLQIDEYSQAIEHLEDRLEEQMSESSHAQQKEQMARTNLAQQEERFRAQIAQVEHTMQSMRRENAEQENAEEIIRSLRARVSELEGLILELRSESDRLASKSEEKRREFSRLLRSRRLADDASSTDSNQRYLPSLDDSMESNTSLIA